MAAKKVSGSNLKQALDKFGSLHEANEGLENENQALGKQNAQLKRENAQLKQTRDSRLREVEVLDVKLTRQKELLQLQSNRIEQNDRQYQLFESFIAMAVDSPSLPKSTETLKALFQTLDDPGWQATKNIDDLRSLFVSTIMGHYLKCFHCEHCGASFIVNKEPHHKFDSNYYRCPACINPLTVKPDDTFLKAMVSEKHLKDIRCYVEIQEENDSLKPFKLFFGLPCEVCKEPITEWTEQNVGKCINGFGWGHAKCWNSQSGQFKQMGKLFAQEIRSGSF
jgi:NAD-dependent SIR2 family protein deacetylase